MSNHHTPVTQKEDNRQRIETYRSKNLQIFSNSPLLPFMALVEELEEFSLTYPHKLVIDMGEEPLQVGCFVFALDSSIPTHREKLEAILKRHSVQADIRYILTDAPEIE